MASRLLSHHIKALCGYLLAALLLTLPLAGRLGSAIAGNGDAPWFVWNLWWFKHSLIDGLRSPFTTDLLYYPLTDVPITWQSPLNELGAIALHSAFGGVIAYNLLVLASFVLTGYTMYLLGLQSLAAWQRHRGEALTPRARQAAQWLAWGGGLWLMAGSYHIVRSQQHLALAAMQTLPLSLTLLAACWRRPTPGRGLAAGVGLALVALTSPYYAAYFLLPAGLVASLWLVAEARARGLAALRPVLAALAVAAIAAALLVTPFYLNFLSSSPELRQAAQRAAASVPLYSADLLAWLLPPADNPLWRGLSAAAWQPFSRGVQAETTLFMGVLPLLIALLWPLLHRQAPRWALAWWGLTLLGWLLSFGPVLRLNGHELLGWMPYRLFMLLPGSYAFRAPARAGSLALVAGIVPVLLFCFQLWARHGFGRGRAVLLALWLAALVASMAVTWPYPLSSAVIPPVYAQVQAAPGRAAVADLPAGEMFQARTAWAMFYQTVHQKPLVSGYIGRRPERLQAAEAALPFLNRFFSLDWATYFSGDWRGLVRSPDPAEQAADQPEDIREASVRLAAAGVEFVIIHRDPQHPEWFEAAALLAAQGLGLPVYSDETAVAWRSDAAAWSSTALSPDLTPHVTAWDAGFSAPFSHRQMRARQLTERGTLTLALPLAGDWAIHALLEGPQAAQATWQIGGQAVTATVKPVFGDVYAARAVVPLTAAGTVTLTLAAPAAAPGDCAPLCVLSLSARPLQPALLAAMPPLARFRGEEGEELELLAAELLPPRADKPGYHLLTAWRASAAAAAARRDHTPPTLFVHLTDAAGVTLAQADHPLGVQGWQQQDAAYRLLDVTALPLDTRSAARLALRIGLWYPDSSRGLTAEPLSSTVEIDAAGRLHLFPAE
ncbi:MAG: hypothetical protein ABTQ73_07820 [Caldilineales bacterium]